jgi:predicted ATPase
MISRFTLTGFKRFASCTLDFRPLTVLTGLNGAGKSSTIQALLLAREATLTSTGTVALNGPFGMELGSAQDVLNIHIAAGSSQIELEATFLDSTIARFLLGVDDETLLHLVLRGRPELVPKPLGGADRGFTYLCAERLGPREVLGASALPAHELGTGVRGEYCAQILDIHGLAGKVPSSRRHPGRPDEVDAFLKYQVEAWLSDVVRPIEVDVAKFPGISVRALRFRPPGGEWVRATNMGFGVSYCLPIVLAGLFAPSGGMLIVENPEAHLHPTGQSRIGVFLATLAASGVQVVLETHSDHVINGIRRTIGEQKLLRADQALVHFFDSKENDEPTWITLEFTSAGNLTDWPPRFFDQYQLDIAALSRVRRGPAR